jgi:magnesium chelatase family protein
VPAVSAADLVLPQVAEGSAEVRTRVTAARRAQAERYAALGLARVRTNAEADGALLEEIAAPDRAGLTLLREAADALGRSALAAITAPSGSPARWPISTARRRSPASMSPRP